MAIVDVSRTILPFYLCAANATVGQGITSCNSYILEIEAVRCVGMALASFAHPGFLHNLRHLRNFTAKKKPSTVITNSAMMHQITLIPLQQDAMTSIVSSDRRHFIQIFFECRRVGLQGQS